MQINNTGLFCEASEDPPAPGRSKKSHKKFTMATGITEQERKVGLILLNFFESMKSIDRIKDEKEREGKKATRVIMAINDISEIYKTQQP